MKAPGPGADVSSGSEVEVAGLMTRTFPRVGLATALVLLWQGLSLHAQGLPGVFQAPKRKSFEARVGEIRKKVEGLKAG